MNPLQLIADLISYFSAYSDKEPPAEDVKPEPAAPPSSPHDGWHNQHFGD